MVNALGKNIAWILLVLAVIVINASATTLINDGGIMTGRLNVTGGTMRQNPGILSEVGLIRDDSQGGEASFLEGPRGIYVVGGYAYVLSNVEDALSVFDISDVDNITEVGYIRDNSSNGTATTLDGPGDLVVVGKYAYVTSKVDDAIAVIDVSDPSNMTQVGYISDNSSGGSAQCLDKPGDDSMFVEGTYLYTISSNEDAISVIDIREPDNPVEVDCIRGKDAGGIGSALDDARMVAVRDGFMYVISYGNASLSIFDVSDVENPVEMSVLMDDSQNGTAVALEGARGLYVPNGNYAYVVSNVDDAISVIDISNKSNPVEVGYVKDDSQGGAATYLDGANIIMGAGKYIYVTSNGDIAVDDDSICVFDVSVPSEPRELECKRDDAEGGAFHGLHNPKGMFINGGYIYLTANYDHSFSIIEIAGIDTPSITTGTMSVMLAEVMNLLEVSGSLYVGNGITTAGSVLIGGMLSVGGNITASAIGASVSNVSVSNVEEFMRLKPGSTPQNAEEGMVYMNSTDHHLYVYNSTEWVRIA